MWDHVLIICVQGLHIIEHSILLNTVFCQNHGIVKYHNINNSAVYYTHYLYQLTVCHLALTTSQLMPIVSSSTASLPICMPYCTISCISIESLQIVQYLEDTLSMAGPTLSICTYQKKLVKKLITLCVNPSFYDSIWVQKTYIFTQPCLIFARLKWIREHSQSCLSGHTICATSSKLVTPGIL